MTQLLQYFLVFTLSNLLFVVLGFVILRMVSKQTVYTPFNVFIAHLMGIVVSVVSFSIYFSAGLTINIILIPILFWFLKSLYSDKKHHPNINSVIFLYVVAAIFVFFIFISKYYNFQIGGAVGAHLDYLTYANISEYLLNVGIENGSLNYFYADQIPPAPYHYFELWLNALFYSLGSFLSLNNLLFITIPTFLFSFYLGLIAFIAHYTSSIRYYALGLILLFVCGTSFDFYSEITLFTEIQNLSYSPLDYYKLLVPSIFVLLSLNFLIRGQVNSTLITLLFLPIVNILFILFIPVLTIFISIFQVFKKIENKRFAIRHTFYGVALVLSVLLFYKLNALGSNGSLGKEDGLLLSSIKYLVDPSYLATAFNIFCKSLLQLSILYIPYFVVFILLSKAYSVNIWKQFIEMKFVVFVLIGIIFYALICWALFHWFFNSFQFFIIPTSILVNTSVFVGIVYFALKLNILDGFKLKRMSALFLLIMIPVFHGYRIISERFSSKYDINFLVQVQNEFENADINPIGGYIKEYDSEDNFSNKSPSYIIAGDFLEYTSMGAFPTSLTAFNMGVSKDTRKAAWEKNRRIHSPICSFYDKEKERDKSISDTEIIRNFIEKSDIEYIVCERNDQYLDLHLDILKTIVDPKSGNCIVFLKRD